MGAVEKLSEQAKVLPIPQTFSLCLTLWSPEDKDVCGTQSIHPSMEKGSKKVVLSLNIYTFASWTLEPQKKRYLSGSVPFAHPAVGEMRQGEQVVDAGLHGWAALGR